MSVVGGKLKGAIPVGLLCVFPKEPASLAKATADTGKDYVELNGATYNVTDYPDLANFFGYTGSTFTVPDMYTTGRFPRSRTAATAALTVQANTVGPHVHPDVTPTTAAETQEHTHNFSGTTGVDSPDHTHTTWTNVDPGNGQTGGEAFHMNTQPSFSATTGGASTRHQHAFSGTTSGRSATHNHTVTVSTPANTGTTETRPEAISYVFTVKT